MLGWLKQQAASRAIQADTHRTVRAVLEHPADLQRAVASELYLNILESMAALSAATPGRDLEDAVRNLVLRASIARISALNDGASNHRDPAWAAVALLESWAFAMSGKLGEKARIAITDCIYLDLLQRVLTTEELLELKQQFERR